MKSTHLNCIGLFIGGVFLALVSIQAVASDNKFSTNTLSPNMQDNDARHHRMVSSIDGIAVTGWNQVLGKPATTLRFLGQMNIPVIGVQNNDGPLPRPIGIDTPLDAVVATYAAPEIYIPFWGILNPEELPRQNIPFGEYPQTVLQDGSEAILPQLQNNPDWWSSSNGARMDNLTVEEWLQAEGKVRFVCGPDGDYFQLNMRNMIPGGLYTIWGFYFDTETNMMGPDFAFGGTSANVFTADRHGKIRGSRDLNFCPMTIPEDDRIQLLNLFVVHHADGRVYSGVDHMVWTPPFIGSGITTSPQVMFAIPESF